MALPAFLYSGVSYDTPAVSTTTLNLVTDPGGVDIPYLERSHIQVLSTTDDGETFTTLTRPAQWDFNGAGTAVVLVTPADGATSYVVRRVTPLASAYVTFSSGRLSPDQLNQSALFALYILQEYLDQTGAGTAIDVLALTGRVDAIEADDWVTTARVADDAITQPLIATDAVTADGIAADAVGTTEIADDAVTTAKILDANVTTAKIADDAVTSDKLGAAAVDDAAIGDNVLTPVVSEINSGPLAGLRNAIINGGFDHWQRGTSDTDGGYNADRWRLDFNGSGAARTVSRGTLSANEELPFEYFLRWDHTTAGTGATFNVLNQRIESVKTFAGETVTLSFRARAQGSACNIRRLDLEQNFGSGGSSTVTTSLATNVTVNTGPFQQFSYTVTLPDLAGKTIGTGSSLIVSFYSDNNTTFTLDLLAVQLEVGSEATPFERRPIGLELALCQRYWIRVNDGAFGGDANGRSFANLNGFAYSIGSTTFPVQMRTTPSSSINGTPSYSGSTNLVVRAISTLGATLTVDTTSTNTIISAYNFDIDFDAEL